MNPMFCEDGSTARAADLKSKCLWFEYLALQHYHLE